MGLDIAAGRRAKMLPFADPDTYDYTRALNLYPYPNHPPFADHSDGLPQGIYEVAARISFRAGSYSGYNRWREALAELVHSTTPEVIWKAPDEYRGSAFYEIIHFSDCEGCIGPKTSRKLAADFAEYEERAREAWGADSYEFGVYQDFRRAFTIAADEGAVEFC
jgi:hypothetical protein